LIPDGYRKPDLILRIVFSFARVILSSSIGKFILGKIYHALAPPENGWLEINEISLVIPRLDRNFEGYRVAHLTDLHIGTWANRTQIEEAIHQVNKLHPDIVVLTGDFVTYSPENYTSDLTEVLRLLKPIDGVYAVLGNHDHWADASMVREVFKQVGIFDLSNTIYTIVRNMGYLTVAGVDDVMEELDNLDGVIEQLPDQGAVILLAHEPDFADISSQSGKFDLQLSGHTHGGQVQLPKIGAVILPKLGKKYPAGLYHISNMYLYTNRGVGTAELHIRYNCSAEIALFILHSSDFDNH
jgi:uncharacterized protein